MKKLSVIFGRVAIVIIAVLMMSVAANAQEKGDLAAGANVVLGSGDSYTNFGIGAKLQYNITTPIRLEVAANYFFEKDFTSMWDAGLNLHYLFPVGEKLTVYPLAGVGILGSKLGFGDLGDLGDLGDFEDLGDEGESDISETEFGGNIGAGIDFKLTEKLFLNVEAKYRIGNIWSRFSISAGVAFRF